MKRLRTTEQMDLDTEPSESEGTNETIRGAERRALTSDTNARIHSRQNQEVNMEDEAMVDIEEVNVEIKKVNAKLKEVNTDLKKMDAKLEEVTADIKEVNADLKGVNALLRTADESEKPHSLSQGDDLRIQRDDLRSQDKQRLLDQENRLVKTREGLLAEKDKVLKSTQPTTLNRLVDIDFEIKDIKMQHWFDVDRLRARVSRLFEWHTKEQVWQEYLAPYFPVVQSSGSGKTKLLYELSKELLKKNETDCCPMIHCAGHGEEANEESLFDSVLTASARYSSDKHRRAHVLKQLNKILEQASCGRKKVVMIFDEAQHLLEDDAFDFRCIRWWLRVKRDQHVVALFTGTSSGLADFFRELKQPSISREESSHVESGDKLYDPFYQLTTTGIFVKSDAVNTSRAGNEYEIAIPYGRPLFAVMHDRGKLDQAAHAAIAQRMTLNERQWVENTAALMSVLGTRVQLGSMALPLATRMVKQGYATLTYFCVAKIAFLPDPVCARLAMCLMADQYEVSDREDFASHRDRLCFRGLPKKEWSRKLLHIFSSGLCHPHKGDLGEVVAALYLLFCGDILRFKVDQTYITHLRYHWSSGCKCS